METLLWKEAQEKIEKGVVLLEFFVTWCGDCKMMQPVMETVSEHFKDNKNVQIIKVNAEESGLFRKAGTRFEVLKVPTQLVLKDGEILFKNFEYCPKEKLIQEVEKALTK
ncbi:thioredoxin family protein [Mycoplasma sp. 1654_15]|uniref:thioredoxin family protein n=1 Tax=Mycoplasma sp. 1654_15 TaxID=2725994 RepID=UPI00144A0761|nr:thioredoxin family protein [Mycoplasma sp. 1654_15]QJB71494.1 thioredoxin family protein [Mycoplasma sp. 1654_15]